MIHTRPRPSKHPSQAGQALGCNCLQGEVRKDIPDPHKFPQKAPTSCKDPLLAIRATKKVLLFPGSQEVEQKCTYVTGSSQPWKARSPRKHWSRPRAW